MAEIFDDPQRIVLQGNSITYYRKGTGETILFVHGITTYSFIWKNLVPYFNQNYDIILIDLLGCGDSEKPLDQDISLKRQAFLLNDFCSVLSITKLHLVCHDVGGGIGQIFAVNFPALLYDLTLVNTVAFNFWPVQPIVAMRTPIIRQLLMSTLDMGTFRFIVKAGLLHKELLTNELMELFELPMQTAIGRKGFLHFAKCLDNTNLTELNLAKISTSVLIVRSEADVYLSSRISERLHDELPNSTIVRITSAGHYIQVDEPETLALTIRNFISKQ